MVLSLTGAKDPDEYIKSHGGGSRGVFAGGEEGCARNAVPD